MSREIELLEKQLAFWKGHASCLAKELDTEEKIANHYAQMLDKTEEELNAERVTNEDAGYRKQEWVDVNERLPKTQGRVLVYVVLNAINRVHETMLDTDRVVDGRWVRWGTSVSHWMPLPEPPKMKGGAG